MYPQFAIKKKIQIRMMICKIKRLIYRKSNRSNNKLINRRNTWQMNS